MSKLQTLIKNKQSRYKQYGVKEVFKDENGAIDLASIMVGVIVIGLIGGVIAATVFAVIPWSQDNAAKQQLDSIVQAENAYFGLSAANPSPLPAGTPANSFGKSAELQAANLLSTGPRYCVTTPDDMKSYTGYSQSGSGAVFTVTDKNSKPELFTVPAGSTAKESLPADCQFITEGMTETSSSTPVITPTPTPSAPYVDPTPNKLIMTYQCDSTSTIANPLAGSVSGTYTWNDGTTSTTSASNGTKVLTANVKYTFIFEGTFSTINSYQNNNAVYVAGAKCLRSVDHWGTATGTTNADWGFYGATNLTSVPANIPSTLTTAKYMFSGTTSFNDPDIKTWDVSKVTNMSYMFQNASSFNQDLSGWNTGLVTDMSYMFSGATGFNGNLNGWNTSKVTNMDHMFYGASSFNQPLNNWNTANVTNMLVMFYGAPYTQDLTSWDMNKVTRMAFMVTDPDSSLLPRTAHPNMFRLTYQCETTSTIANPLAGSVSGTYTWNDGTASASNGTKVLTANVKYTFIFEGTFSTINSYQNNNAVYVAGAKCLRSVDHWGTATGTTNADWGFYGATNLTNVPANIPSTLTTAKYMFSGTTSFNDPDIKTWDVSKVTSMSYMLQNASGFNQDLSGWNTGLVTDMSYMFSGATAMNSGLNGWNTSKITNMDHMFFGASSFNQPLNNWNTSNVTNMLLMFYGAPYSQDLTSWDMNKVTRMAFMVTDPDSSLLPRTAHPNMFRLTYQCDTTSTIAHPVAGSVSGTYTWNDGTTINGTKVLTANVKYTFIFEGTFSTINSYQNNSAVYVAGAKCLRSVDHWGTATGTTNADWGFYGATNLTSVPANIPSTLTTAKYMFSGTTGFNDPNIKSWDVSKVTNMSYMFQNATSFNQDLKSSWNTAAVTNGTFFAPASFPDAYMPANTSK